MVDVAPFQRISRPSREVTAAGLSLVQHAEGEPGTGKPMLQAYKDSAGIATIGWGHTRGVSMGMSCTADQALQWLDQDLDDAEFCVDSVVKVTLTDPEFDALVSLVFNIGVDAFKSSTLLRLLNAGDYAGAAAQFAEWNKVTVNGQKQVSAGLTNRRTSEAALFTSGMLPNIHVPPTMPLPQVIEAQPVITVPTPMARDLPVSPPTTLTQAPGGKTGIAALTAGAAGLLTEAWNQVQPTVTAMQNIANGIGSTGHWVQVAGALLAGGSVATLAYSLWKQHRAVRHA